MTTNNNTPATLTSHRIDALTLKRNGYTVEKSNGRILCYKCFPGFIRLYDFYDHMVHHLTRTVNRDHAAYEMNSVLWESRSHGPF